MKKSNNNDFIYRANLVHNNKYDYSKSIYVNSKIKTTIICSKHGEFEQTPNSHLKGSGCPICYREKDSVLRDNTQSFIYKANLVHNNKYKYSDIDYINSKTKVKINCEIHGDFKQKPNHHLNGHGCPKCGNINIGDYNRNTLDEFINKAIKVHSNKYDYSKSIYVNSKIKTIIICPVHGEFMKTPNHHLKGSGCPTCKESKGEKIIREWLIENKIKFKPQYKFSDCKYKRLLPFDFYLPDYNICIEFNGIQHYKIVEGFVNLKEFNDIQIRDAIKKKYCNKNNIKLIIIKYDEKIVDKLKSLI